MHYTECIDRLSPMHSRRLQVEASSSKTDFIMLIGSPKRDEIKFYLNLILSRHRGKNSVTEWMYQKLTHDPLYIICQILYCLWVLDFFGYLSNRKPCIEIRNIFIRPFCAFGNLLRCRFIYIYYSVC